MFMRLITYPLMYFNLLLQLILGPLQLMRYAWVLLVTSTSYNFFSVLTNVFLRQQYSIWMAVWVIISEPFLMLWQVLLLIWDIILFFLYTLFYFFILVGVSYQYTDLYFT